MNYPINTAKNNLLTNAEKRDLVLSISLAVGLVRINYKSKYYQNLFPANMSIHRKSQCRFLPFSIFDFSNKELCTALNELCSRFFKKTDYAYYDTKKLRIYHMWMSYGKKYRVTLKKIKRYFYTPTLAIVLFETCLDAFKFNAYSSIKLNISGMDFMIRAHNKNESALDIKEYLVHLLDIQSNKILINKNYDIIFDLDVEESNKVSTFLLTARKKIINNLVIGGYIDGEKKFN